MRGRFTSVGTGGVFQLRNYSPPSWMYGGRAIVILVRSSIRVAGRMELAPYTLSYRNATLDPAASIEDYLSSLFPPTSGELWIDGLFVQGQRAGEERRVVRTPFSEQEQIAITLWAWQHDIKILSAARWEGK